MYSQNMRTQLSPEEKFNALDSDGDGGLNISELETMTTEMAAMSGQQAIAAEKALATYDANEDGTLDMDEIESMMADLRDELGPPPDMKAGGTMADALASYLEESDENTLDTLFKILANHTGTSPDDRITGVDIDI